MPVLSKRNAPNADMIATVLRQALAREAPEARSVKPEPKRNRWLETCTNPACRTGWMQVWRNRTVPVFEEGWTCSEGCMADLVRLAVLRENKGRTDARPAHRHRLPLGLLMLEQGWITGEQLRGALEMQRKHGDGHLGKWLVKQYGISEELVARALALQWSCPVLRSQSLRSTAPLALFMPRLFVDAFGVVPFRLAAGKVLYLGFEDTLDPVLARSVERMTGIRTECGVVTDSQFSRYHERALRVQYPAVELVEAVNEETLTRVLTRAIEKAKPAESRLVRVHEFLWLRMLHQSKETEALKTGDIQDVICTIGR